MRGALLPVFLGFGLLGCAGVAAPVTPAGGGAPVTVHHDPQAGLAPLRRLTREQYANTVRDLLGITDPPIDDLPIDEGAGGFYSNVIAPVTELQIEKYRSAAETLAARAAENLPALLPCTPEEKDCADRFITRFGRRVYRRPLLAGEEARYRQLFAETRARSDFENGVRVVVETMLQSINFLYRFEPAPAVDRTQVVALPPYAMASRLSYFLWNTMPDETLFAAAEANALSTTEQIAVQAARMVADARFTDAAVSFHLQWLDVVELPGKEKRKSLHPLWSENLRMVMGEETVRFVTDVIKNGDGRLETLLTAPYTIAAGPLITLYGPASKQPKPKSDKEKDKQPKSILDQARPAPEPPKLRPSELHWQRVDLDPAQRAGLLTQASVLTVHAHWDKSSLVHRGKLIREKFLCEVLPPPPPDVNNTLPPADPKVSARERFEEHRAEVSCAKCHRLIDPLGAPFEMFDAIGNFRTKDGPNDVDSEGELTGTRSNDGPVKNAVELARRLSTADEVRECVARQWLRFALGREETAEDGPSLSAALTAFRASDYRIPALVVAITRTDAFRNQQVTP